MKKPYALGQMKSGRRSKKGLRKWLILCLFLRVWLCRQTACRSKLGTQGTNANNSLERRLETYHSRRYDLPQYKIEKNHSYRVALKTWHAQRENNFNTRRSQTPLRKKTFGSHMGRPAGTQSQDCSDIYQRKCVMAYRTPFSSLLSRIQPSRVYVVSSQTKRHGQLLSKRFHTAED